ncbi:AgrD family cyclic lactone autoinducer peptide [Alkalimonas cellulosilytica]
MTSASNHCAINASCTFWYQPKIPD